MGLLTHAARAHPCSLSLFLCFLCGVFVACGSRSIYNYHSCNSIKNTLTGIQNMVTVDQRSLSAHSWRRRWLKKAEKPKLGAALLIKSDMIKVLVMLGSHQMPPLLRPSANLHAHRIEGMSAKSAVPGVLRSARDLHFIIPTL